MFRGHHWPVWIALGAQVAPIGTSALAGTGSHAPSTETLERALARAYQNNPQLNAQRAATRATDETVGVALSGYRPQVSGTAQVGEQYLDNLSKGAAPLNRSVGTIATATYGLTTKQTLFDGFQTASRTRLAEGQVFAARETLRTAEQTILLNAAIAYMNLLRDSALLELQRNNVKVLEATLRQTRDRFTAGEVTRTDLAQAESSLAAGRSSLHAAESNYITSKSAYVQTIGVEPGKLASASPVDRFSPPTLAAALERAASQNPTITTAMYNVDAAVEQVKVQESFLYPTLSLNGSMQKTYGSTSTLTNLESLSGSVVGQLS